MCRPVTVSFVLTAAWSLAFAKVIERSSTDGHPRYAYKYSVNDPVTKDIKEHWEARDGEYVKGSYSLVEPDGKLRIVDYWADDSNGFNANVKRTHENGHLTNIVAVAAVPVTEIPVVEVTEIEANDVRQMNPVVQEPVVLEPVVSKPVIPEPVVSEPVIPEPVISEPVIPEPEIPKAEVAPLAESGVLKPLTPPDHYGFGAGGHIAPLGLHYANVHSGSYRWDPKTGSYGGWVPLPVVKRYATIFSKKYIDGKLHKWTIGPISLVGRTLVFKVKH